MYYLGVDGGGTKTKYILVDNDLKILSEVERGTTHLHQIGIDNLKLEILEGINEVCNKVSVDKKDLAYIFLGIPGYGESENDKKAIEKAIGEVLEGYNYKIDNDSVAGWAAGTLCEAGINIVAGTGSIAFGMNDKGIGARVGGWGPNIGDDGSAHWIGLRVINEYTKQKDNRHEKTVLLDIIEKEKEIKDYFGIVELVFNKYKLSRTEIAAFCRLGKIAADNGCVACKNIFKQASYQLFLQIKALREELNIDDEFIISYTGGVFKAEEFILDPLKEYLDKDNIKYNLIKPKLEPWHGSALMAYKLGGNEVLEDRIVNESKILLL